MTRTAILFLALVSAGVTACSDDAPAEAPPKGVDAASGWGGIGELVFGMNSLEVRQAWKGGLEGPAGGATCFELVPAGSGDDPAVQLMIEDDKFVRYSVASPAMSAPGGGKVGMQAAELADLYPRMASGPHKYVEGGRYLQVEGEADRLLVFEADADGKVSQWRVGEMPQVAYVEGCG